MDDLRELAGFILSAVVGLAIAIGIVWLLERT